MDLKLTKFDPEGTMFYFHNNMNGPLMFYLHSDTDDKFYKNILNEFFAKVVDRPRGYAMVLAWPKDCTYTNAYVPAFDIKFIEDCFKLKKYPDPTKYFIETSCPSKYSKKDIFDCWYFRKKSWFDVKYVADIKIQTRPQKRSRLFYTEEEEIAIAKYTLENKYALEISHNQKWRAIYNTTVLLKR